MWTALKRELNYLITHPWDLCLVTLVPAFLIIVFSGMFLDGKPEHLPIAVIDHDHSELSRTIEKHLSLNHTIHIEHGIEQIDQAEDLINRTEIWGYVHIPEGAERSLVQAQDPQISIAYNLSFFSIGNTLSTAVSLATVQGIADYLGNAYLENSLPYVEAPTPNVKISPLFNPTLSYELYLEPFLIPAIMHLLLCCCVAFSVGQELKYQTVKTWLGGHNIFAILFAKTMPYILIFSLWTWAWMFWLTEIRGWSIAGSLWFLLLGQFLFYAAYALLAVCLVLGSKDLLKTFGLIAVYGGSSLSFAGVTLPLNNAPTFTKFWSYIIPYTPYARLQTEQWVVGSPIASSLYPFGLLMLHFSVFLIFALLLIKKTKNGVSA